MPYITRDLRKTFTPTAIVPNSQPGCLNYQLTVLCLNYIQQYEPEESYTIYNDVIGALESCKLEMYRRKVSLYEDKKIEENGDVY